MVILHSKRLVFIHVSKSAGMWATRLFETHARSGDFFLPGPNGYYIDAPIRSFVYNSCRVVRGKYGAPNIFKHSSAREIFAAVPVSIRNYESVAILRDPVARAISMFTYARQTRSTPANKKLANIFAKLKLFEDVNDFILSESFGGELLTEQFFRPQSDYVRDPNGKIMVGRLLDMERVEAQMQAVCDVPVAFRGHRVNSSEEPNLILAKKARSKIEQLYACDYALIERVAPRWSQV